MAACNDEITLRLKGWRTTSIEVCYYMPDHRDLLQLFFWQTLDLPPRFPRIHQFLQHWRQDIEAVIHSVRLASEEEIASGRWRHVDCEHTLH